MTPCGEDLTASFEQSHPDDFLLRPSLASVIKGRWEATPPSQTRPPTSGGDGGTVSAGDWLVSSANVSSHNASGDCWVVVHCVVLDVTAFMPNHSGDKRVRGGVITPHCGRDISLAYDGSGHPGTYVDISLNMGAVRMGRLSQCNPTDPPKPPPGTKGSAPSTASVIWYAMILHNITGSVSMPPSTADVTDMTSTIHNQLAANNIGGLSVVIEVKSYQQISGEFQIHFNVGFGSQDLGALTKEIHTFAASSTGLTATRWRGGQTKLDPARAAHWLEVNATSDPAGTGPGNTPTSADTKYTMAQVCDGPPNRFVNLRAVPIASPWRIPLGQSGLLEATDDSSASMRIPLGQREFLSAIEDSSGPMRIPPGALGPVGR